MGLLDFLKRGEAAPLQRKTPTVRGRPRRRSYSGAMGGRLVADFLSPNTSADAEIRYSLRTLRDRSRELGRNHPYVSKFFRLLQTNVIGPKGLQLQVKAVSGPEFDDRPEDAGKPDLVGNRLVERAWKAWSKKGTCELSGRLSWRDCQRLAIKALAQDGEVFIQPVRNADNPFGFAIRFFEPDHVDHTYDEQLPNGNQIRMGVEVNQDGKAIAYHVFDRHPGDYRGASRTQRKRIAADGLIHIFVTERPGQTRGVPWTAPVMIRTKMLDGYEESELVAARVAAAKMGFFTQTEEDSYQGEDFEDEYTPIMNADPGTFELLPSGMEFQSWDPQHPTTAFKDFQKAILRSIASGLGVSYNSLASDLESVNYSSLRQGALEERDVYRELQEFVIEHMAEPIYLEWLTWSIAKGALRLPMTKFEKFATAAMFRGRGFAWVDPKKEIDAEVTALQNGLTTLQEFHGKNGADLEDVFEEIGRAKELAAQHGIELAFEPFGGKQAPAPPPEVPEE